MTAASAPGVSRPEETPRSATTTMAYLLHALNQPLTGLQCSLELAAVGTRPAREYVQTLRDGLELVGRMRVLVEALRELSDLHREPSVPIESVPLDVLLCDAAEDLTPIAKQKGVNICAAVTPSLPVLGERRRLEAMLFRFLEAVLALAEPNTALQIAADRQGSTGKLTLSWHPRADQNPPLSPPELGLLIVQAAWEHMGGLWRRVKTSDVETCTVLITLASSSEEPAPIGEWK